MKPADSDVELEALVRLFYDNLDALGDFAEVSPDEIPQPQRALLAHNHHMTVSIEGHHLSPVNVIVLDRLESEGTYSRKILLALESTGAIVQYGIVRLDLSVLEPQVREEILARQKPLGRILITHNVMREVKLHNLFRILPSQHLADYFEIPMEQPIYGRTALIYCNGAPAVELLEIVSNC